MSGEVVEGSVSAVEAPEPSTESSEVVEATPVEKAPFEPPSWIYEAPQEEAPQRHQVQTGACIGTPKAGMDVPVI